MPVFQNVYDEVADGPGGIDAVSRGEHHRNGYMCFNDEMPLQVVENKLDKVRYFYTMPRPIDGVDDTYPMLYARTDQKAAAETDPRSLYGTTTISWANMARYIGPHTDMPFKDMPKEVADRYRKYHFIDDVTPEEKIHCRRNNLPLPTSLFDTLMSRAHEVTRMREAYQKYFPKERMKWALKARQTVWFWPCYWYMNDPETNQWVMIPSVNLMSRTAKEGFDAQLYKQQQGYIFPTGANHEQLSTREALNARFDLPDLADPRGTCQIVISGHKQNDSDSGAVRRFRRSRGSGGAEGNKVTGNRFIITVNRNNPWPIDMNQLRQDWVPPEKMLDYSLRGAKALRFLLDRSPELDWSDFLRECVRGTEFELPSQSPGITRSIAQAAAPVAPVVDTPAAPVPPAPKFEAAPPPPASAGQAAAPSAPPPPAASVSTTTVAAPWGDTTVPAAPKPVTPVSSPMPSNLPPPPTAVSDGSSLPPPPASAGFEASPFQASADTTKRRSSALSQFLTARNSGGEVEASPEE